MKKSCLLLIALISLLLPTTLFAGSAKTKPTNHSWNSFYVSLGLGSELLDAAQTSQAQWSGGTPIPFAANNQNASNFAGNSVLGHLGLGFAIAKHAFYLGVEPYLEISDLGSNSHNSQIFFN